jgi:hypothetical protein
VWVSRIVNRAQAQAEAAQKQAMGAAARAGIAGAARDMKTSTQTQAYRSQQARRERGAPRVRTVMARPH